MYNICMHTQVHVPKFSHTTVSHTREVSGISGQEVVGRTTLFLLLSSRQKALRREEGWAGGEAEGEGAEGVRGWEREGRVGGKGVGEEREGRGRERQRKTEGRERGKKEIGRK